MARALSRWWVYVLRCGDGTLYTGVTNDPARRLRQHSDGTGARYTRSRLPVTIVYQEAVPDRGTALRREAALKRLSRPEKLALIAPRSHARSERKIGLKTKPTARPKWTVPPVYRAIVKKNERQASQLYDVLVCGHAVAAATDNTFRKARPCPECRVRVQDFADQHAAQNAAQNAARIATAQETASKVETRVPAGVKAKTRVKGPAPRRSARAKRGGTLKRERAHR